MPRNLEALSVRKNPHSANGMPIGTRASLLVHLHRSVFARALAPERICSCISGPKQSANRPLKSGSISHKSLRIHGINAVVELSGKRLYTHYLAYRKDADR